MHPILTPVITKVYKCPECKRKTATLIYGAGVPKCCVDCAIAIGIGRRALRVVLPQRSADGGR